MQFTSHFKGGFVLKLDTSKLDVKAILGKYNEAQGIQLTLSSKMSAPKDRKSIKSSNFKKNKYDIFLEKYTHIEETIDTFTPLELLYLIRETAGERDYKYVITNVPKDLHMMKILCDRYSSREIWNMIDFLYNSDQDYLDKSKIGPNILISCWCNTIYPDSQRYIKGEYSSRINKQTKRALQLKKREWSSSEKTDKKKVGDW